MTGSLCTPCVYSVCVLRVFLGSEILRINYSSAALLSQIPQNPFLPLSHLQGLQDTRGETQHADLTLRLQGELSVVPTMVTDDQVLLLVLQQ